MAKKVAPELQALKDEMSIVIDAFNDISTSTDEDFQRQVEEEREKMIRESGATLDTTTLNAGFKAKATDIIKELYKFYGRIDPSKQKKFIQDKIDEHVDGTVNLLNQLYMVKQVTEKMYTHIMQGCVEPRVIEAFNSLNKQLIELRHESINWSLYLESETKKYIHDAKQDEMQDRIESGEDEPTMEELPVRDKQFLISADQKRLIAELKSSNEISEEEVYQLRSDNYKSLGNIDRLISPDNKPALMTELNINSDMIETITEVNPNEKNEFETMI